MSGIHTHRAPGRNEYSRQSFARSNCHLHRLTRTKSAAKETERKHDVVLRQILYCAHTSIVVLIQRTLEDAETRFAVLSPFQPVLPPHPPPFVFPN